MDVYRESNRAFQWFSLSSKNDDISKILHEIADAIKNICIQNVWVSYST